MGCPRVQTLLGLGFALATAAVWPGRCWFSLQPSLRPLQRVLFHVCHRGFALFLIPLSKGKFLAFEEADRWMWASRFPMGACRLDVTGHRLSSRTTEANAPVRLWAILLVAWPKKNGLEEGTAPKGTQIRRLLGAFLLLAGIYLAPLGRLDRHAFFCQPKEFPSYH